MKTNEDNRIQEAFWSVADGNFSEENKKVLLEHWKDAYTYENRTGIDNPLTRGKNTLSILVNYFERDARPFEHEEDAGRIFEGTLGEMLAFVSENNGTELPVELQGADSYNLRVVDIRNFYDWGVEPFTVEEKSQGIRATIEANKEKAATKEPTQPSKEHAIGKDR